MTVSDLIEESNADSILDQTEQEKLGRVDYPKTAKPLRIYWLYFVPLSILHFSALLAFVPWFFSWSGVVVAILGHFFFGMLGITVGYHRLLTHRGFVCPKWLEHTFAILGLCNLQDSPARWVAIHRMHHQHSDHQPDPHTPMANLFWAHMGWVIYRNRDHDTITSFERYARDLLKDPFYMKLERNSLWFLVFWIHAAVIGILGGLFGYLTVGPSGVIQTGASWLVWGVFIRTLCVLHGTWSVNSIGHVFGYKNYKTRDDSRNNWLVALISHGEGWHNNHHAQPRVAHHGHRWFEFDMSWWVIVLMEKIGLATNVVRAKKVPMSH